MDQQFIFRRSPLLALIAALLVALAACGTSGSTPEDGATQTPGSDSGVSNDGGTQQPNDDWPTPTALTGGDNSDPLSGTAWVLQTYGPADNPQTPVESSPVTLEFDDGTLRASPGCNHYGADYSVRGDKISMSPGAMTEMACADERLMTQEQELAAALSSVTSYELAGDSLTLNYEGGVLHFSAKQAAEDRPLEGTVWSLETVALGDVAQSLIAGTNITLELSGGTASGSGGCNSYSAEYSLDGEALTIGQVSMTLMACEGGIDMQESTYVEMLQQVRSFSIEGDQLTLTTDGGQLIFRADAEG